MRRAAALAAFALLSAAWGLAADSEPYSLEDCVALALERESSVILAEYSLDSSEAELMKSLSGYYPRVRVRGSSVLDRDGAVGGDREAASLSASQTLFDSWIRELGVRSARAGVRGNEQSLLRARQTVAYNVTRRYFSMLEARKLLQVQDARIEYLETQLEMIKARVEVGVAAEVDLLPLEAQLSNARVDRLRSRNALKQASLQLQDAMGLDYGESFDIRDVDRAPVPAPAALEDYEVRALGSRPDLEQSRLSALGVRTSLQAARIRLMPRLNISADYGRELVRGDNHSYLISAAVEYDLFDGESNRADYRRARNNLLMAEERAARARAEVLLQVRQAYLDLEGARELDKAAQISLKVAETNAEVQEARYREGLATPLDILNAQLEVITASSSEVRALYGYHAALAQLEHAVGGMGGIGE